MWIVQNIQKFILFLIFSYNQNGEIVNQKTVDGKIYVANFIFTSCGSICPKMTDNRRFCKINLLMTQKFYCYPILLHPKIAVLKEYAKENGCIRANGIYLQVTKKHLFNS
jgi:protein SCO1/2